MRSGTSEGRSGDVWAEWLALVYHFFSLVAEVGPPDTDEGQGATFCYPKVALVETAERFQLWVPRNDNPGVKEEQVVGPATEKCSLLV